MATERREAIQFDATRATPARSSLVDAVLILAAPLALLAVFSLSESSRLALALEYTDPSLASLYLSHFVHLTPEHLLSNLLGYALVVPTAYLLCVLSDRRALFRVVLVTMLLVLPVALSGLNLLFVRPTVGYGFSGVVMGLFGFLPLALFGFVESRSAATVERELAPALFFVGIVVISTALYAVTAPSVGVAVLALLITAVYVSGVVDVSLGEVAASVWRSPPGDAELGVVALLLFLGYPFVAFPTNAHGGGTIVNLYTHLLGYAIGFIATYALLASRGFEFE